jgi:glycosyltransferase involved in cell wall biosynthesis
MRILYCNKYNFRFSGTESYLFETMELMRARGHEVALFSMADPRGQPTSYDHHFVSHVDFKRDQGLIAQGRLAMRAIYSIHARKKIRAMVEDFRPDVAHVRNIYHHLSPSILWELKVRGVPVLYHMNDLKLFCPSYNMVSASGLACGGGCKGGRFWHVIAEGCYCGGRAAATVLALEAYIHRWLRTYERCVDMALAPSEFVKQQLIENGWSNSKVQVLSHFQQLPLKTVPHPGPDAPVLYFGRLSAEKGLTDLIAAMSQIPYLRLIIAGSGPQRADLEKLVSERGLKNVSFAGHVAGAALEELIAGSQFTIFPSRAYETFGKSILESYAQGRAVVASDLGSRRELVHEGETGVLYQVGNVNQLAAAIKFLLERPELARAMGEAGRELVHQQYSPERHFIALSRIYEQLANTHAGSLRRRSSICQFPLGKTRDANSRALKIAYIGGRGVIGKYSGIETYYEETGKRLAAMGHEVTVYCRRHFTPETTMHNGMRLLRLTAIRSKHLETLTHTLFSTVHVCLSDYDLVHYHALGPSWFSFLPRLFGKKTLVTVQGLDWQRRKWSWFARAVLKGGEWASVRLPNQTVVVSRTLEKRFHLRYTTRAVYIPNGTEMRETQSGPHLSQFGLVPKEYVLFLGRFSPEKNCDLLIDAFERTQTTMTLVLAGGSSHTDDYATEIRKRESDRIKIQDWLSGDALQEVLTNAALFVLPSDLEGLSLSLLEAMSAGVCVLASDTPENCEVIQDCGFTFRAGSADDLQRMLSFILGDAELRAAAGQKARARVEQNYLWDQVVAQIEATYRDVIAQPARASSRAGEAIQKSA